jgi:hypothetical protein
MDSEHDSLPHQKIESCGVLPLLLAVLLSGLLFWEFSRRFVLQSCEGLYSLISSLLQAAASHIPGKSYQSSSTNTRCGLPKRSTSQGLVFLECRYRRQRADSR